MHRRYASVDRIHSARSDLIRSPYAKNYRTNLTHDQRELLSQRQNVSKLKRTDLEDRYIALMDEHFSLKKDNASNHEKIKKLATKLLRMSADGKHRGVAFPLQLAPNENLEIQIVKLESYNALLKDRLNAVIRRFGGGIRSASVTGMRPASCSNISMRRKLTISQDDLNLFEIPELSDDVNNKIDENRKYPLNKCKCRCPTHHPSQQASEQQTFIQRQPFIIEQNRDATKMPEAIFITPASPENKVNINDLKNTIRKLENDISEVTNDSKRLEKINRALEERLTNEIVTKRISENVELIELRHTVVEYGTALNALRAEYLTLKSKTEAELNEEQQEIRELTNVVENEMERNKAVGTELASLKMATNLIESMRQETHTVQDISEISNGTKRFEKNNRALEKRLTNDILTKRISENVELIELRRTVVECSMALNELRAEYLTLKSKTEAELNEEQQKIHELTNIVENEIERNKALSTELASLKNATNLIDSIGDETQTVQKITDSTTMDKTSQQLTKMLLESTKTIGHLREDLKSARNSIKMAQQHSDSEEKHERENIETRSKGSIEKNPSAQQRIPLEPHIEIISPNSKPTSTNGTNRSQKDKKWPKSSSSSDGGTYNIHERENDQNVVKARPERAFTTIKSKRKTHHETASEVSSIDSDENFKTFKTKNRNAQNSLLLVNQNGVPLDLSARLNILERAAYHQPLTTNHDGIQSLICNCQGGCRRTNQSIYEDIHVAVENAKALLLKEFKNYPLTDPNDSNAKSISLNGLDDSSECREFLRVQYNLNNLYKQELELMCRSCKEQTETLINEIYILKEKNRKYEDRINTLELSSSDRGKNGTGLNENSYLCRILDISRDQGTFEMHVESFKLTKEGHSLLSCKHGEPGSLYFSWNFFTFKTESRTSLRKGPTYSFQNASVYLIDIRKSFLQYIKNDHVELRLLAEVGASSITVGKAVLNLSEVLIFPQNKIQLDTRVMSIDTECRTHTIQTCSCQGSATKRKHLGNLSVWFRLTCDMDALKMHIEQFWIDGKSPPKGLQKKRIQIKRPPISDAQNSERDNENSSIDGQSGFSLSDGAETFVAALRPNEISFVIGNLTLFGDSDITQVKHRIYIEYNFNGTNESQSIDVRKVWTKSSTSTTVISIDFRKVFAINQNSKDRIHQRLSKILRNNEKNIKFLIVGEQAKRDKSHKRSDDNECFEMALGLLHLGKILADTDANSNEKNVHIPMMSKNHPYTNVGNLEITIEGIVFMKNLITGD